MEETGLSTALDFSIYFLDHIGIATVPGSSFYANPTDGYQFTRFCFCKKPETLAIVYDRLQAI